MNKCIRKKGNNNEIIVQYRSVYDGVFKSMATEPEAVFVIKLSLKEAMLVITRKLVTFTQSFQDSSCETPMNYCCSKGEISGKMLLIAAMYVAKRIAHSRSRDLFTLGVMCFVFFRIISPLCPNERTQSPPRSDIRTVRI